MKIENVEKSQKQLNALRVIAGKLSNLSIELFRLTGKAPTIEQLLKIEFARFAKHEVIASLVEELTMPGWLKDKGNLKNYSDSLGKILAMGRVLLNHSPAKYQKLIEKHLQVTEAGVVQLSEKSAERVKAANTIRLSRKAAAAIEWSRQYADLFNEKPAEDGLSIKEWATKLHELMEAEPGLKWIYNGAAYPDTCKLENKVLSVDEVAAATKY